MPALKSDFLKLHGIVILLGLTAILGKLISVPTIPIVFYRTLLASAAFAVLFYLKKGLKVNRKDAIYMLFVGSILGLHWFCFFGSARLSTVSLSLVTFSTTSFFTSIIEPLSKKQAISKKELFLGLLVISGMAMIFSFEREHTLAILVGLLGSILSSIYSVANVHLSKRHTAISINFFQLSGAFIITAVVLCYQLSTGAANLSHLRLKQTDLIYFFILSFVCTVYPYLELIRLFRKISAFSVNLAVNMEPIYGILLAWVIFGESEKMTNGFYWGAGFIIASLLLNFYWNTKKPSLSE